jgi:hypothetical protein
MHMSPLADLADVVHSWPMARPFAAVALAVLITGAAGCGGPGEAAPSACGESRDLVCAMSDYASTGIAAVRLADGANESRFGVDLGKDPALAQSGGRLFLLARDQDLLFELDATCGAPISKTSVHDDEAKATQNPQDVAVDASGALWIPRFNDGSLLVIPRTGPRAALSLAAYDEDGSPQPASATTLTTSRGERVFVALERLDRDLVSRRPSAMLEVDPVRRAVVASHPLVGQNPFGPAVAHDGALWLAAAGSFDRADEPEAGVARFDPETGQSRLVVGEASLGGSVVQLALRGSCGAAIVASATRDVNSTSLVTFDVSRGAVVQPAGAAALSTPGYDLQGLTFVGDALFVGDRRPSASGGHPLHAFVMDVSCTLLASAGPRVSVPQRPVSLRAVRQATR